MADKNTAVKRLRRRHDEVEVDEISLVKEGGVGKESDVVVLLKAGEDADSDIETTEDAMEGGPTVLEKDREVEATDSATSVEDLFEELSARSSEFSPDLEKHLVDLALSTANLDYLPGTLEEIEGPTLTQLDQKLDGLVTLVKAVENIVQVKMIPAPKAVLEEDADDPGKDPVAEIVAAPEQVTDLAAAEDPAEDEVAELEKSSDDPIAGALKLLKKREKDQEDRKSKIDHVALIESMSKLSSHVESMVGKLDGVKSEFGRACGKDV